MFSDCWRALPVALLVGIFLAAAAPASAERATVLVAVEPAKPDGRDWDVAAGADPILCFKDGCYRSDGPAVAARHYSGTRALNSVAALNLFGKAGACTGELVCTFRNVDIPMGLATMRVIDVDMDRHDRMAKRLVTIDPNCALNGDGRLWCNGGMFTSDYTVWIVPEKLAEAAGPEALEDALAHLANARAHYLETFASSEQKALPEVVRQFYRLVLGREIARTCPFDPSVIAATFEIAGLLERPGVNDISIIEKFVEVSSANQLARLIEDDAAGFWRLHDAIDQMHMFATANTVERANFRDAVAVEQVGGATVLQIDIEAEAKAQAALDRCVDGLPVAAAETEAVVVVEVARKKPVAPVKAKAKKRTVAVEPITNETVAGKMKRVDEGGAASDDEATVLSIIGQ